VTRTVGPRHIYRQTARRDSLPLCDQQHLRHRGVEDAGGVARSLLIDPAVRCVLGDSIALHRVVDRPVEADSSIKDLETPPYREFLDPIEDRASGGFE